MQRAPVVPDDHVVVVPIMDVLKLRLHDMRDQAFDESVAVRCWHALHMVDVECADIQHLALRFRMHPDERVQHRREMGVIVFARRDPHAAGFVEAHLLQTGPKMIDSLQVSDLRLGVDVQFVIGQCEVEPAGLSAILCLADHA